MKCNHASNDVVFEGMLLISILFLPLDAVNYAASLNATRYVAEITVDTPIGTPVIYLSVSINRFGFTDTQVFLTLLNNTNDLLKFSNGKNDEQHLPGSTNTNTVTIESRILYNGSNPALQPDTYELTIQVVVINPLIQVRRRAFVTVNLPTGE